MLIGPFIVAGIGISFVFPTLANAAVGSVPLADSGVAAGSNNTMREAGGLFGVEVLAAVFTANGSYASRTAFMHGSGSRSWPRPWWHSPRSSPRCSARPEPGHWPRGRARSSPRKRPG